MKDDNSKKSLFVPYYVNQGRLLDIFAILNDGYSDYAEISTSTGDEKRKDIKGEIGGNIGFKLFNIGTSMELANQSSINSSHDVKERKVQTVSSMLSHVISRLERDDYIRNMLDANARDFIKIKITPQLNSIKRLIQEALELTKLSNEIQLFGETKNVKKSNQNYLEKLSRAIQVLFDGEEIVYESDEYAVFGNLLNSHFYQGTHADIIGTELTCFAQIKNIYPEGTDLLRNTIFTKIKDKEGKDGIIKSLKQLSEDEHFEFEAKAIDSIVGKPVYQLEIMALYQ